MTQTSRRGTPNLESYDFVDFGCGSGGSITFGIRSLGGRRGLGLDINPEKVDKARAAGFEAEIADVTQLDPAQVGTVRFALMAHFLEHLPGRNAAKACIESAGRIAEEFIFIRQPYFDADGHLFLLGLKLYWSDWTGHPYHMTSLELHNILEGLLKPRENSRFLIFFKSRIRDSRDTAVHPVSSRPDQHDWTAGLHDPKPRHKFSFPVYRETGAVILMNRNELNDDVARFLRACDVVFDSAGTYSGKRAARP